VCLFAQVKRRRLPPQDDWGFSPPYDPGFPLDDEGWQRVPDAVKRHRPHDYDDDITPHPEAASSSSGAAAPSHGPTATQHGVEAPPANSRPAWEADEEPRGSSVEADGDTGSSDAEAAGDDDLVSTDSGYTHGPDQDPPDTESDTSPARPPRRLVRRRIWGKQHPPPCYNNPQDGSH